MKEAKDFDDVNMDPIIKQKLTQISITPENYYKIGLIFIRIQANIPIILMGETGIGKTSLIRLLSNITEDPIKIINIHAGVTSEEVIKEFDEIKNILDTQEIIL